MATTTSAVSARTRFMTGQLTRTAPVGEGRPGPRRATGQSLQYGAIAASWES
jgi:hypothetical protein